MADSSGEQHKPHKVGARLNIASSASEKADCPEVTIATTPQEVQGQDAYCSTSATLKVTLLGSEWNSSAGGLSTLNREFAIHLSKHPNVDVSFLVPEGACKDEEKRAAQSCGVAIVDAKKRPAFDPLDWLSFPPPDLSMDIVVGHGVKLGRQGQVIRDSSRFHNCKWVQMVHTAPEDLSKYKSYADPISKGERKHQDEVDLCKVADLVVPVGPRLEKTYSSYLRRCKKDQDVFSVTPGLFEREFGDLEQAPNENADFKVLIFGRGDDEDFELKGYNIAAEAFTDQRLKQKPYHLIFVGAPEGKQKEVRQKLLRCGIPEEQLTVRKFIQSRDRMKDLLCEVDLAIMPLKSEGFGLVTLEALSAGLPILVGSKSGFAKALENVPFGKSCIVYSDDPSKWAEAIEAVCVRHGMRLEEIKALRASYEKKFSWKDQCEALVEKMLEMVYGPSKESGKIHAVPKVEAWPVERQLVAITHEATCKSPEQKPILDAGKQASRANEEGASSLSKESLQIGGTLCISGNTPDVGSRIRLVVSPDLSDEQKKVIDEMLTRQIQVYTKHHQLSTPDGVGAFIEYVMKAYDLALESVDVGSLIIKVQCPTLESLESLWNDYRSGHLNEVAERFLVTDEIKRKLNLDTVRLKTTIEEENYLMCKKALMEKSLVTGNTDVSSQKTEPGLGEDTRWIATSSVFPKDQKQKDLSWMARAEKAKASRSALHKAAISGEYETVKMLLDSGEDVDQRDQFSLTPLHLACWYGQESVVKQLLEHGANVNAVDRFQRTPLQKAERHNHQSTVQLLLRSNANPSYQQPLILKSLAEEAFLQVNERSGFNLLQVAVFKGKYGIVFKAHGLLSNFVKEMNFETTANNAKLFPGKTAIDILSSLEEKGPGHAKIDEIYQIMVKRESTLTELHRCSSGNDAEKAVEFVLNDGVDINIPALCNRTPLFCASGSSSSEFIKTLIDLGADVNAQRTDVKVTPLTLAAISNHYMATRMLLEHGADPSIQGENEYVPLRDTVLHGYENIVKLLLKNNAGAHTQDIFGDAPLHDSVCKGFFNLSRLLIEAGSNVNLRNKQGRTPLYIAVKNKHEQLIKLLLESSADVNMGYKEDPENRIYLVRGKIKGKPVWHYVLVEKHLLGLFLKKTKGGSLDVADFGTVFESGWGKDPPKNTIDKILKKHEYDAMFKEIQGETLLHVASRNNNTKMIDQLVEYGADINAQDGNDFTPLHMAAIHGNIQVVKELVDLKADVNLTTADGKDAVDLAHLNEETEIEVFLTSKMAFSRRVEARKFERDDTNANVLSEAQSHESVQHMYSLSEGLKIC